MKKRNYIKKEVKKNKKSKDSKVNKQRKQSEPDLWKEMRSSWKEIRTNLKPLKKAYDKFQLKRKIAKQKEEERRLKENEKQRLIEEEALRLQEQEERRLKKAKKIPPPQMRKRNLFSTQKNLMVTDVTRHEKTTSLIFAFRSKNENQKLVPFIRSFCHTHSFKVGIAQLSSGSAGRSSASSCRCTPDKSHHHY